MDSPCGITIATVCARGGSKRQPGKNMRPFPDMRPFPGADGVHLIAHTIGHAVAVASARIEKVYVSTDDEAIAEAARKAGAAGPYLRPAELATDHVGKLPSVKHLVAHLEAQGMKAATVVDLQPTSPLRILGEIERCLEAMGGVDLAVSVYESGFLPALTLVELAPDRLARLYAKAGGVSSQALPPVYP